MLAEIITIGDEILYGQITDTNSQWISEELNKIGIKVRRKSSVGDQKDEIISILEEARQRAHIIIMTGGLGPTNDDITKKTLADYFNSPLQLNVEALEDVLSFFTKRGKELTEINRQQAFLPSNCTCLRNKWGTAPGMWFEENNKVFVSLPGVPYEMKNLLLEEVFPRLTQKYECPVIHHKMIKTAGIGESFLAEKIKDWEAQLPSNMKLAYLPSHGEVRLRITALGNNEATLTESTNHEITKLTAIAGQYIYGYDNESLPEAVGKILTQYKLTVATAESCTGGQAGQYITSIPGSSNYYLGGIIAYDNKIKKEFLGVDNSTLSEYGAVSEQTVKEMAEGIRKKFNTSIGLSTSGIAGPGGGTIEKPVGTVWIAYSDHKKTVAKKLMLGNDRALNTHLTVINLLNLLRLEIGK